MSFKSDLEFLRGEQVVLSSGDPASIPCIETSDTDKLCKHPVVSVIMATYNHEPYIRRAIEGVMMQQTDFEFELIIGEDCSQDRTREICFECQKKYPDKIRVLWWHENVSKLGGNGRRILSRCRGDYLAWCEGDDYWTDPRKLQKQVDLIRRTGSVFCVASSEWRHPDGRVDVQIYDREKTELSLADLIAHYFHTTTYLADRRVYFECHARYPEILYWYDCVVADLMATMGKVCHLPDVVSVYNWTYSGMSGTPGGPKNTLMLVTQFLQFVHCSNRTISSAYVEKLLYDLVWRMGFGIYDGQYAFEKGMRRRALRLALRVARERKGWASALLLSLRMLFGFVKTPVLVFYLSHPRLMSAWRRFKSIFK